MTGGRKPNWGKWKHVPDVKVWEGVALSLDIEPDQVRFNQYGWMGDGLAFKESKELDERIFVAKRNLTSGGSLQPTSITMGDPARSMVRLSQFAEWALSLGWWVPAELAGLASPPTVAVATETPGTEKPLEGKGRASALKLILGMAIGAYSYDPKATRSTVPKEIMDDLLRVGINLTDETVREWLRVAADEVDRQPLAE